MKIEIAKAPAILIASVLAVLALVVFQLTWMRYSRQLSEEIFNQRASMALCSTIEKYSDGAMCSRSNTTCCVIDAKANEFAGDNALARDSGFQTTLRQALDFYQIDLDYQVSLSSEKPNRRNTYQCAISLPSESGQPRFVNLIFPQKEAFVLGKMNFMVIATVLILLFIAAVLLLANWSLLKQKRLLQTNVDFFNNMAHEFRTPLTNIGLATNMFAKKHEAFKDNPMVEIIRRENAKLQQQVERVLQLASMENGDFALKKENLPVKDFLNAVREEMAIQIEERNASVSIGVVPEQLVVEGDRLHLSNVFRNLLDNALKYGGERPDIRIAASEHPKGVLISVQDNGIGIPAGQSSLIFEKFQRVSHGNLHEQKGFGLGLAYVKSMVNLHKGSVRMSSEPNCGTRFEVFLPSALQTA